MGVDGSFREALQAEAEFPAAPRALPGVPLVANMVTLGKSPLFTAPKLAALGYKIARWRGKARWAAAQAVEDVLTAVHQDGTTGRRPRPAPAVRALPGPGGARRLRGARASRRRGAAPPPRAGPHPVQVIGDVRPDHASAAEERPLDEERRPDCEQVRPPPGGPELRPADGSRAGRGPGAGDGRRTRGPVLPLPGRVSARSPTAGPAQILPGDDGGAAAPRIGADGRPVRAHDEMRAAMATETAMERGRAAPLARPRMSRIASVA